MGAVAILEKDVVQANPLIEARKGMNVTEMRLFVLGLQDIKPHIKDNTLHDVEFHETIIPYSELVDLFGSEHNGNVSNLKKQVEKASRCVIELSSDNGGFGFASIYRKIRYEPNKGLIIHFNDELKPYILELVNQAYTRYKVKALFSLSSSYSWRILESLLEKQGYLRQGNKEIFLVLTIEEVRFRLNIKKGKYEGRIDNLRKFVLDEPIKEINEKTDYFVWYEVIKTGRKVTGFKLYLKLRNPSQNALSAPSPAPTDTVQSLVSTGESVSSSAPRQTSKEQVTEEMKTEGFSLKSINSWFKIFGDSDVIESWEIAIERANSNVKTKHKGVDRRRYIKALIERNVAEENRLEREIIEREKRLAKEKAEYSRIDDECIEKLADVSVLDTEAGEKLKQKETISFKIIEDTTPKKSMEEIAKSGSFLAEVAKRRLKESKQEQEQEKGQVDKAVEVQMEEQGEDEEWGLFEDEVEGLLLFPTKMFQP